MIYFIAAVVLLQTGIMFGMYFELVQLHDEIQDQEKK